MCYRTEERMSAWIEGIGGPETAGFTGLIKKLSLWQWFWMKANGHLSDHKLAFSHGNIVNYNKDT